MYYSPAYNTKFAYLNEFARLQLLYPTAEYNYGVKKLFPQNQVIIQRATVAKVPHLVKNLLILNLDFSEMGF